MVDCQERILPDGAKLEDLGAVLSPRELEDYGGDYDLCLLGSEGESDLLLLAGTERAYSC